MDETPHNYTTDYVISKDGTKIGYRQLGQGPGVIVLHGGMESAASHAELAEALSSSFTVYLPDRRGRGLSGPVGDQYGAQKEVEDMQALLAKTKCQNVFGISSGAIVWLNVLLASPAISKAVIYEPPLPVNGIWSGTWTPRSFLKKYDEELATGDLASALALGLKVTQMGPPFMARMPHWLLKAGSKMMMSAEDKKAKPGDVTMRMLTPSLRQETQLIIETEDAWPAFKALKTDILLLSGELSPAYLKNAVEALGRTLPNAHRTDLPGVAHGGSGNKNRGGKPEMVAQVLREFFSA